MRNGSAQAVLFCLFLVAPASRGQPQVARPVLKSGTSLRYELTFEESLKRKNFPHGLELVIATKLTLPLRGLPDGGLSGPITYGTVKGKASIGEEMRPFSCSKGPGINRPGPRVTIKGDSIQAPRWNGLRSVLLSVTYTMGRTSLFEFRPLFERSSWVRSPYHHVTLALPPRPVRSLSKGARWDDPLVVARPAPGVTLHFDCVSSVKKLTKDDATVEQSGKARLEVEKARLDPRALEIALGPKGGSWTSEFVIGRSDGRLEQRKGEGSVHLLVKDPKSKVKRPQALVARWSFSLKRTAR